MPLVLLNKPYRTLSQFTSADDHDTLGRYVNVPNVYPCGRLDHDSEGLLLLTDDGQLQARISQPRGKLIKAYWAQVEGVPTPAQIRQLMSGVRLKDGPARAVFARQMAEPPGLWPRHPPIRYRASVPDSWLAIGLTEGRNRQVRRMTAAVGLPTLRLIREAIGPWSVHDLQPGETRQVSNAEAWQALATS